MWAEVPCWDVAVDEHERAPVHFRVQTKAPWENALAFWWLWVCELPKNLLLEERTRAFWGVYELNQYFALCGVVVTLNRDRVGTVAGRGLQPHFATGLEGKIGPRALHRFSTTTCGYDVGWWRCWCIAYGQQPFDECGFEC